MKKLKYSAFLFIIVGLVSLYIVLNKGHVGTYALVSTNEGNGKDDSSAIIPQISIEIEKEYIASNAKKNDDKGISEVKIIKDGEIVTEGFTLTSSNEKIAKINEDNQIVAVSDGRVTITASYDGIEASGDIKVITPIKSMSFTTTNSTVRVGKDLQMKLQVTPSNASLDTLSYESSDEEIATVDSSGIVTGVAPGKVKITVYDSFTETEKTVNLTIRK